jgi:hypothetical protein
MGKVLDLSGRTFGMLTVIKQDGRNKWGQCRWLCECACGSTITVDGGSLHKGATRSCGCLRKNLLTKHGVSIRSPRLYHTIRRHWEWCYIPSRKQYKFYGEVGWKFDERWLLPNGKPNYEIIEQFALANGWDESDNTLIFEKDFLAQKLGVKIIGQDTVRFVHDRFENAQYSKQTVKIHGIPVSKIARLCNIQPRENGHVNKVYRFIRNAVYQDPTIPTLLDALTMKGVSKEKLSEVERLFS